MSDLMPKEFYEAFRNHFGFGQLTASASSDAYQMLKAAEWAWQASRECLVIDLEPDDPADEGADYLHQDFVKERIQSLGLKVKP